MLLILSEVTYLPSLSSLKDSAHFVTGRTREAWAWLISLHHLGQNQAIFLKANQGFKRLRAVLVSGVAH